MEQLSDLIHTPILYHKGKRYHFTVSIFNDAHYISIREYYMDEEENWLPGKVGVTLPYNIETTAALFSAFTQLLSNAEVLVEVLKYVEFDPRTGQIVPKWPSDSE